MYPILETLTFFSFVERSDADDHLHVVFLSKNVVLTKRRPTCKVIHRLVTCCRRTVVFVGWADSGPCFSGTGTWCSPDMSTLTAVPICWVLAQNQIIWLCLRLLLQLTLLLLMLNVCVFESHRKRGWHEFFGAHRTQKRPFFASSRRFQQISVRKVVRISQPILSSFLWSQSTCQVLAFRSDWAS